MKQAHGTDRMKVDLSMTSFAASERSVGFNSKENLALPGASATSLAFARTGGGHTSMDHHAKK